MISLAERFKSANLTPLNLMNRINFDSRAQIYDIILTALLRSVKAGFAAIRSPHFFIFTVTRVTKI